MRTLHSKDIITKMRDYKKLEVWKKSIELAAEIYKITNGFPKEETYSLTDQIRRAVVSIASNLAEGYSRYGDKEFLRFLYISRGSIAEVETQLYIALRVGYLTDEQTNHAFELCAETNKMIGALIKKTEQE